MNFATERGGRDEWICASWTIVDIFAQPAVSTTLDAKRRADFALSPSAGEIIAIMDVPSER